jgi:hypothetical protein
MGGAGGDGGRGGGGGPSIDELLDSPGAAAPPPPKRPKAPQPTTPVADRAPVEVRVVWGALTRVAADVHVAGHYQGVMPTSAEGALDAAISGPDPSRRIIAEHTRRQWFLGDFGHVNYFPSSDGVVKVAAVAGMGRPGTFTEARCRRLAQNLLVELCALGRAKRVATVGIGSGAGNLSFDQTARALAAGFADALQSGRMKSPCTHIDVVEYDRLRAERFLAAFEAAVAGLEDQLTLVSELATGEKGEVSFASASIYALREIARCSAAGDPATDVLAQALAVLGGSDLAAQILRRLAETDPVALVSGAEVTFPQGRDGDVPDPVRISVLQETNGTSMRVAAITGTATVPERQIQTDPKLIEQIVRRMSPPASTDLNWLAPLMSRMVLPGDLQTLISVDAPLVFEVDRHTAQIHWELVVDLIRSSSTAIEGTNRPLVLQTSVSRQLRTTYSRVPAVDVQISDGLNVLVIGDPGPETLQLPEARAEALAVYETLFGLGVNVTALIGAPPKDAGPGAPPRPAPAPRAPSGKNGPPSPTSAGRLDVLRELLPGKYQIVHYCGHGTFDADDATRAGWVFEDGLLTARELAQLGTPPRLVVANACFTARLAGLAPGQPGRPTTVAGREAQLAPSLADEFFRSGVSHYVGAAWKVADADAKVFSVTFYKQLLGAARATMGEALTQARNAVWESHPDVPIERRGTTWAAYQHYGDPGDRIVVDQKGGRGGS